MLLNNESYFPAFLPLCREFPHLITNSMLSFLSLIMIGVHGQEILFSYQYVYSNLCVVPENIHIPPMEKVFLGGFGPPHLLKF